MPRIAAVPLAMGCVVPAALPRGSQGPADHAAFKLQALDLAPHPETAAYQQEIS